MAGNSHLPASYHWTYMVRTSDQILQQAYANHPAYHDLRKAFKRKIRENK
jgi:hypothetical protein